MSTDQVNVNTLDYDEVIEFRRIFAPFFKYKFPFFLTFSIFVCVGIFLIFMNAQRCQYSQILKLTSAFIPAGVTPTAYQISLWGNENKAVNELQQVYIPVAYRAFKEKYPEAKINMPTVLAVNIERRFNLDEEHYYQYIILKVLGNKNDRANYVQLYKEILLVINNEEAKRRDELINERISFLKTMVKMKEEGLNAETVKTKHETSVIHQQIILFKNEITILDMLRDQVRHSGFVDTLYSEPIMSLSYAAKILSVFVFMGILMGCFVAFIIAQWRRKEIEVST